MSGAWRQELSCFLPCVWFLTVQELGLRRKGGTLWAKDSIVLFLGPPKLIESCWGRSDFSHLCAVPCPSVSLPLAVIVSFSRCSSLPISPVSVSLPIPDPTPVTLCLSFQAASVPGQRLCISGPSQSHPGPGEMEMPPRRWAHFWGLCWRGEAQEPGSLDNCPNSRQLGAFMAASSLPLCLCSLAMCVSLFLLPEEIYGNWSLPLNTSHIWHPRIREVGLHLG